MSTRSVLPTILSCFTILMLASGPAAACTCLPQTPEEALANASAVFSAEVVSVTAVESEYEYVVELHWLACWKGEIEGQVVATTAIDGAMCGYGFDVGRSYLIYAHGEAPDYTVSLCSRTTPMYEGVIEDEGLGEPKQVGVTAQLWGSVKKFYRD